MYRTIFCFTNSCGPELAHRLQTSKMRRNSTSLDSCQHDAINIVTVSVARRRWTAPLKPRRPCVKNCTTFYALLKHVSPKGDYFTPKGYFFAPWGHYYAHWCEKRPFSLSVNGAQMRVLHACVKKKNFGNKIVRKKFEKKNLKRKFWEENFQKKVLRRKFWKKISGKNFGQKNLKNKFWKILKKTFWKKILKKSFDEKKFRKNKLRNKIFITKIYSNIDKCHTIFALLAPFDKTGRKTGSN